MPLFVCNKCGTVENTALSNFWITYRPRKGIPTALCSGCDIDLHFHWHGMFERKRWDGKSKVVNRVEVEADGQRYWVDPNTVKEAEPERMLCRAWKAETRREVMNFARLDQLARMVAGKHENVSETLG